MTLALRNGFLSLMIVVFAAFSFASGAEAAKKEKIDARVAEALAEFHRIVGGSEELLANASGVLLFPSVKRAKLGGGDEKGQGALIVDGDTVAYYRTTRAFIGPQPGPKSRSQILLFMTDEALIAFRHSENWKIGDNAFVTLVTLDAGGHVDTKTIDDPVIAFVYGGEGLLYNLTLEGAKISQIYPK